MTLQPRLGLWFLFVGLILVGCGGETPKAPIKERAVAHREPEQPTRTVRTGDTLYSIAWESGRDFHELAAWNNLPPPYVIRPGQVLRLFPPKTTAGKSAPPSKPTRTEPSGARKKPERSPERPVATEPAKIKPGIWSWPVEGEVIERFGTAKGIAIAGRRGQAVRAAAPGTVVYQGSGLRGYGELIIIKHDADFLSAYAHNDKVLVKEGNVIRRGQKIAEMGASGADRVKLHFEIRRRGKPVDPLIYLPKK